MPLIEVSLFEDELTREQSEKLIGKITEAIGTAIHPKLRDLTWVVVHEVKSGNWGIGGKAVGLADIKKIISG